MAFARGWGRVFGLHSGLVLLYGVQPIPFMTLPGDPIDVRLYKLKSITSTTIHFNNEHLGSPGPDCTVLVPVAVIASVDPAQ